MDRTLGLYILTFIGLLGLAFYIATEYPMLQNVISGVVVLLIAFSIIRDAR